SGVLDLVPVTRLDVDPILGRRTAWRSDTPYRVCRHRRAGEAHDAIREDVLRECLAHALPPPAAIEVKGIRVSAGLGPPGVEPITFAVSVSAPLLLGRTRHKGGGVFEVDRSR